MSMNLVKGGSLNLTKESVETLNKVMVGIGWDPSDSSKTMDADLSLFCLNASGKCNNKSDFVYFNNLQNGNGSIKHAGDNLTGEGDGDDEQVNIDLNALDPSVSVIDIIMNIYDAKSKGQNLSQLKNSHVRIVNAESNQEIAMFDVHDGLVGDTLHFGKLTRTSDGWVFNADGNTSEKGLGGLGSDYGIG